MTRSTEQRFLEELRLGNEQLKRDIGYNASYFNQMVGEFGPVEASRRLIRSNVVAEGFTKLWRHGKLDMTVEALSLLPWYAELFDEEDRTSAQRRLRAYKFDVEAFIARRRVSPPSWPGPTSP
jgi:hypothetical protein